MSEFRENLAWAAGLFDGEGHISCRSKRSSRPIVLTVSQHHTEVLERFQAALGFGTIYESYHTTKGGYYSYSWRTGKFEYVQAGVAMMWQWLGAVKRAQATSALKLYHSLAPGNDRVEGTEGGE